MSRDVIMPALGMAQKTGLIVAWLKKPGDAVKRGEALMEVETDKAVMEVEAQADGILTDVRAAAGEAIPVGEVIAVIADSAAAAKAPQAAEPARAQSEAPATRAMTAQAAAPPKPPQAVAPAAPTPPATGGRVLASPKTRRLAAEQGLDLARLAAAGVPQPYHVADLTKLTALSAPRALAAAESAPEPRRLAARVSGDGFAAFCAWVASESGAAPDATAILAAMAAAALRQGVLEKPLVVAVEAFGRTRHYADPDRTGLGGAQAIESAQAPALILRDLRATAITSARMGGEAAPALSVMRDGGDLVVSLECAPSQLPPEAAVELMSGFAGRLAEPLRHLL